MKRIAILTLLLASPLTVAVVAQLDGAPRTDDMAAGMEAAVLFPPAWELAENACTSSEAAPFTEPISIGCTGAPSCWRDHHCNSYCGGPGTGICEDFCCVC